MRLHGITIQLLVRKQIGTDAFNAPIYQETAESVPNVLVGQPSSTEVSDAQNLTGKKIVYWLGIPKGDTHDWENVKVILPAPFSGTFRTFGYEQTGILDMIPLSWGRNIAVERYVCDGPIGVTGMTGA